jgi:SAM-dependent methyltransferase
LLLAERGHRVTAIDLRPVFLEYAQSRHTHGDIKFIAANVLEDEIPGNFDLIFANQIIEHLVYPEKLLTKLRHLLISGGRLVVTTPNGAYLRNALPSFRQLGNPKEWEHLQHTADGDGHFYAYLLEELLDIFKSSGFVDVRGKFFESPFISGHMKIRYAHRIVPGWMLSLMDRAVVNMPLLNRKLTHQLLVSGIAL